MKGKSSHDLLDDNTLSSVPAVDAADDDDDDDEEDERNFTVKVKVAVGTK